MTSMLNTQLKLAKQALAARKYLQAKALYKQVSESCFEDSDLAAIAETGALIARYKAQQTLPEPGGFDRPVDVQYQRHCDQFSVDVVIPVHNALAETRVCLASVLSNRDGFSGQVIVINDASDQETSDYLRFMADVFCEIILIENSENLGYTKSINLGLESAKSDYQILLNSDTEVSKGWMTGLVRCMRSDLRIGVVGPLSNAASWQNVPDLYGKQGEFAVNQLPEGWSVQHMAEQVKFLSNRSYPKVPFVNGFCFMLSSTVWDKIGAFDDKAFPMGYGEENDYCLRAKAAGFELAIADDVYIYHAKSKSFGHQQRRELSRKGQQAFIDKHPDCDIPDLIKRVKQNAVLNEMRRKVNAVVQNSYRPVESVGFLLPLKGSYSGGIHSIVQEANAMRDLGVNAQILVPAGQLQHYRSLYDELASKALLFRGVDFEQVAEYGGDYEVLVATIYSSMKWARKVRQYNPKQKIGYYLQDDELLFADEGLANKELVNQSYDAVNQCIAFAKTDWIAERIYERTGLPVFRVTASVDHTIYFPTESHKSSESKISICAMIRPSTPRRGAKRTLLVLERLKTLLGNRIQITLFGCDEAELKPFDVRFEYVNLGVLDQKGVAKVLQGCQLFLDLSDYQAFGRTALEAMACGCIPIITHNGGVDEFLEDGINGFKVDVTNIDATVSQIQSLVDASFDFSGIRLRGLATAQRFTPQAAALSELSLFYKFNH